MFTIWNTNKLYNQLDRIEKDLMALADTLTQLQTEDVQLKADVEALIAKDQAETDQIAALTQQVADLVAAGSATPEQLAALQTVADDLAATHAEASAATPPAA